MKAADRFDLGGQGVLAQKPALSGQRDPELADVAQGLAVYRIKRDPQCPLAVRRLLPWVYLRHGNLLLAKTRQLTAFFLYFRAFETGFPAAHYPHSETHVGHALARPLGPLKRRTGKYRRPGGGVVHNHSAGRLPCAPSSLLSQHSCRVLRSRTVFAT